MKKFIPVLVAVAVLLTACGPQGTPTLAPAEVEGTAVAAAWTMVAMTQLAIPTATPLPPTETPNPTPLPTFTPLPLPTLELIAPTATQKAAGTCEGPLNVAEAGPKSDARIENETGGKVLLSLHLDTNLFGQCGYLTYNLNKNEKLRITIPKGLYFGWAQIDYGKTSGNASGYVNNRVGDNHLFVIKIKKEVIVVP